MKNILTKIGICTAVMTAMFAPAAVEKINASDYYPMACTAYEVDTVSGDGFTNQGCYDGFDSAKAAMNAIGRNAVVRHSNSKSPTKIIAMTDGIVYSFLRSSGLGNILTITQNTSAYDAKTTYISDNTMAYYEETLSYDGCGDGKVLITATDFTGTASLKEMDLIPSAFIESGTTVYRGGNAYDGGSVYAMTVAQNYFYTAMNGNYRDLYYVIYSGYTSHTTANYSTIAVGPAPDWMQDGVRYYSKDDVHYYADCRLTQAAGTYYNYYEFLPLRTRSSIPASAYNGFLNAHGYGSASKLWNTGDLFLEGQEKYGVNAMLVFAQAIIESAWGTSYFAKNYNNLFGWEAYDSDPSNADSYDSVEQCILQQMAINLRGYIDTQDWRFFSSQFGNKGAGVTVKYASNPNYGLSIAAIAYQFDKYASGNDGSLTDYNNYSLGVVNTYAVPVLSSDASTTLFTTEYGPTYQNNFVVAILSENSSYYKIQSTDILNGNSVMSVKNQGYIAYDWDTMTGLIEKKYVTRINSTDTPNDDPVQVIEMYRLYNPNSGEHFYTASAEERDNVIAAGWNDEGIGWYAPSASNTPVYRLYNKNGGEHHYTMDASERDYLTSAGWLYEDIGWYSDDNQTVPIYREYNPNAFANNHNYTVDKAENDYLISISWLYEGIGWYGVNN